MTSSRRLAVMIAVLVLVGGRVLLAVDRPRPFPACYPSTQAQLAAQQALQKAADYMADGKLQPAIREARKALRLVPTSAAPHVILGLIAERQNRTAEAISEYREALAWDPDESRALAALDRLRAPRYGDVVSQYEAELLDLINQERTREGLCPLKPHPVLAEVARAHSRAMRDLGFFSHISPKPGERTSADRFLKRFDGKPRLLGENISRRWKDPGPALSPEEIARSHAELMMSTGHRRNILHPDLVYAGIGIAINARGDYWITELFLTPKSPPAEASAKGRRKP